MEIGKSAPILQHPHLWQHISHYLNAEALLKCLFLVGNPRLSQIVRHNTHRAFWHSNGPLLKIEAFLIACNGFQALKELIVIPRERDMCVQRPSGPLYLPPTLTTLDLRFYGVFILVQPLKLSSLTPSLRSLKLYGINTPDFFELEQLDLPPLLEVLEVEPQRYSLELTSESITKLPRSLIRLSLSCSWSFGELSDSQENDPEELSFISSIPIIDWPPSLTFLSLRLDSEMLIESLPRTITTFKGHSWGAHAHLLTTFPQQVTLSRLLRPREQPMEQGASSRSSLRSIFPWRRFFPLLQNISLSHGASIGLDKRYIVGTLVLPDALETKVVDEFISSTTRNVTSLDQFSSAQSITAESYPTMKKIKVPKIDDLGDEDAIFEALQKLAPYLKDTDFPLYAGPLMCAHLLPSLSSMKPSCVHLQPQENIPTSLRAVDYLVLAALPITKLPPQVRSIRTGTIIGGRDDGDFGPGEVLPSSLRELLLNSPSHQISLFSLFPVGLLTLKIDIASPKEWALIAERLVSLQTLHVRLPYSWTCKEATVAKIASQRLKTFDLSFTGLRFAGRSPTLIEFFSSPSTFPSSLEYLQLGRGSFHVSILAILPPNLLSLSIDDIYWTPIETGHRIVLPNPIGKDMTPDALLKCLPPKLVNLRLLGSFESFNDLIPSIDLIKLLPQSLCHLDVAWMFDPQEFTNAEISAMLPPYLQTFMMESAFTELVPAGFRD